MTRLIAVLFLSLFFVAGASAQEKGASLVATPQLTETQKLTIQVAFQSLELAQLKLERARTEAQALMTSLQKPGYLIDLQKMEYVPEPASGAPRVMEGSAVHK